MGNQNATGIKRLSNAFGYSMLGFAACFKHEEAFRQEVIASLLLIPLALYVGDTGVERALLLGSWLVVPLVELLNSAIENAIDRIGAEQHELSGRAKDIGSAAVFLALLLCACVWLLVLLPRLSAPA
ncbi:MAG: diacylglycerol kinase [Pseudomonadota bacterium]|nr:diacylglycerol kinase [Pseudomonadota bacterium]